jgi:hypothetical protein
VHIDLTVGAPTLRWFDDSFDSTLTGRRSFVVKERVPPATMSPADLPDLAFQHAQTSGEDERST